MMRKDTTKKFFKKYEKNSINLIPLTNFKYAKSKEGFIDYDKIVFKNMLTLKRKTYLDKTGAKVKERISKNNTTIEFNMVYCNAGGFTSSWQEEKKEFAYIEESFLIGDVEITQEFYELLMGYNPSAHYQYLLEPKKHPVECVTWFDCLLFCNELSRLQGLKEYYKVDGIRKKERTYRSGDTLNSVVDANVEVLGGNGYRLPTKKEWEYAAKAGTNNRWSGCDDENYIGDYVWYKVNAIDKISPYSRTNIIQATQKVATRKPNEWGIYDMSGNVNEWCWDKVSVGGSITNKQNDVMINFFNPNVDIEMRMTDVGFRVARNTND